jgi:triacylglycerol lipase
MSTRSILAILALAAVLAGCGGGDDDGGGGGATPTPTPVMGNEVSPFDLETALELGRLCLESYQMLTDFENGQTFTLPAPYTLQAQFLTAEHYPGDEFPDAVPIAFVATSGEAIYVVFRGTKTIPEWIADATLTQVPYPFVEGGGSTETGFTRVYSSIDEAIVAEVNTLAATNDYDTLYVTGHSLGAAVATLAAPQLARETRFDSPVFYNFASPRTGDPIFADLVDELPTSWRIANSNDEVPKLPPAVTIIFEDDRRQILFYDHIDSLYGITFGEPIRNITDLGNNHAMCNYYFTLCDQTDDPTSCKQLVDGLDDCEAM